MPEPQILTPGEAAAVLGVSADRVKQLPELEAAALRTRTGRRFYPAAVVEQVARQRDSRAGQRDAERHRRAAERGR